MEVVMKNKLMLSSLVVFALIISACASATPVPPSATATPVAATNSQAKVAMPSGPAAVDVGQNVALGSFLVDAKGMTLYAYANDTANTSTCTATCATNWPPLLTNGAPTAGAGVTASMLGTLTRADGSVQVTYDSKPLYYFAADKAAGDTKGEGVKSLWYVLSPAGTTIVATPAAASSAGAAVVDVSQNATLGSFLVDSKGMTLYLFTKDTPNTSNCYSSCAAIWPPLLTSGSPVAGAGVTASLLGTTTRTDGTTQVTYNGWPLYYFASDKAAGDTTGENVQGVWFVITPAGMQK
jgi:predicted lipoprotein with Yx(FWY)xxD motif